jgi:hypothetical protein
MKQVREFHSQEAAGETEASGAAVTVVTMGTSSTVVRATVTELGWEALSLTETLALTVDTWVYHRDEATIETTVTADGDASQVQPGTVFAVRAYVEFRRERCG